MSGEDPVKALQELPQCCAKGCVSELYRVWRDLELIANKFCRIIGLLRGSVERLCIYRQLCGARQHDTRSSPPLPSIPSLSGLCAVRMWSSARGALASGVVGCFWPDPKTRAADKEQRRLQPGFEWSCCWFRCLGSVFSRGLGSAVEIWSMGRKRDRLAFTAAVLSWAPRK